MRYRLGVAALGLALLGLLGCEVSQSSSPTQTASAPAPATAAASPATAAPEGESRVTLHVDGL